MSTPARSVVAVVGPTGSGKSELAIELCLRFGGEVVSCDALQVYRELHIGTAKLPRESRRGVPHHLLDVAEPDAEFSAADYVERASEAIAAIATAGQLPVVAGGTGLYLRALRRGLFVGPGRSEALRARLAKIAERRGHGSLHRLLRRWDPESAERVHPNDVVRVVRALEVRIQSGRPMSELMTERRSPLAGFHVILVGLEPERSELESRIEARVRSMIDQGLVSEVRRLRELYGEHAPAFKAIGYREVVAALARGDVLEETLIEEVQRATRRYAKRQQTWFRSEPASLVLDARDPDLATKAVSAIRAFLAAYAT
mgnify:CR=1 FL=1